MSEFLKNTIIVVIAAVVTFLFGYLLERIKRKIDSDSIRRRDRKIVQLTLRATQKVIEAIKLKHRSNAFFDYIYLGQLKNLVKRLDRFRFGQDFMQRNSDQSDYFDLVSRLDLLIASMVAVQNYEDDPNLQAPNKAAYIATSKGELITELVSISDGIDSQINLLDN